MPRITGPIQRVSPAKPQTRVMNIQPPKPRMQTPRVQAPAPARAKTSGVAYRVAPRLKTAGAVYTVAPNIANTMTQATASTSCCCAACTGLQCLDRTRFFSGQLLTEADLNNEQSYLLAKNRLHNRYLNGWGVVCGLQVTCGECNGWVNINPGYALDPCGNDIIVCAAQSFNVLQAIQACCAPPQQATNCSPLRYSPPPACQDTLQKFCITVQYVEQPTQMVTPLQPVASGASSCGCGGSGSGGCACGCSGNSKSSGCGCGGSGSSSTMSSSSASSSTSSSTAACQPTRILEGFQFGVCALPATQSDAAQPGSLIYQITQCVTGLVQLVEQAPTAAILGNLSPAQQYTQVCNYVVSVQQYFLQNSTLTYCSALDALNRITVKQGGSLAEYEQISNDVRDVVIVAFLDCICLALLPQCPPAACDNRVPLACVTVQNGIVQSICHFECRKQLIGFTALGYWLEPLLGPISTIVDEVLELLCCPSPKVRKDPTQYFASDTAFDSRNVTTSGFTNSAMLTRALSSFVSQKMGASLVNSLNPNLNAVDMRPFVGQTLDATQESLFRQGFSKDNLDIQRVDGQAAWGPNAVSASAQFAPAAVSASQPVTLYIQNNSVVGIEVTDPTRTLQLQVLSLTKTIGDMQTQLNNMQGQTAATQPAPNLPNQTVPSQPAPAPAQPAPAPAQPAQPAPTQTDTAPSQPKKDAPPSPPGKKK
jgi:hypothetical protein